MCGRFVSASPPDEIARYFDADETALPELEPSYNVAPTNDVYAVAVDGGIRKVEAFHWGLVPSWAKDPKIGSKMINARSEGIATKNAYRAAIKRRRCIIPADGFYEWQKVPDAKRKQPHYIHRPGGEPLAFAGLWEVWRGPDKDKDKDSDEPPLRSCTIITTSANETMAPLHDRMPVILPPSAWDEWLDPANDDLDTLGKLLVPAPVGVITTHPVSTEVNSVRNKGAELITEVDPANPTLPEPEI
ncbi:MAG: SOS response-associated peptidase [Acidimicrobiales bacterium]